MDEPTTTPASQVVREAVRRAALQRVATTGPHWIGLVVNATRGLTLPATPTAGADSLGKRLEEGAPLTPLADPATGGGSLGAWGVGPSTVGDLLEARDTDGRRVAGELELQCAIEAARLAPRLAHDLAGEHPGLADRLAEEHAGALVQGGAGIDAAEVLCAEVAAIMAVELAVMVREQLASVPLGSAEGRPPS